MRNNFKKLKAISISYIAMSIVFFMLLILQQQKIFSNLILTKALLDLMMQIVFLLISAIYVFVFMITLAKCSNLKQQTQTRKTIFFEILNHKIIIVALIVFMIQSQLQTNTAWLPFLNNISLKVNIFSNLRLKTLYSIEFALILIVFAFMITSLAMLIALAQLNKKAKSISTQENIVDSILVKMLKINQTYKRRRMFVIKLLWFFIKKISVNNSFANNQLIIKAISSKNNQHKINTTIDPNSFS